jgi:hypothetical protein
MAGTQSGEESGQNLAEIATIIMKVIRNNGTHYKYTYPIIILKLLPSGF